MYLPNELWAIICSNLDLNDRLMMRKVCLSFYYLNPIHDVLRKKYGSGVLIMEEILLRGDMDMYQWMKEYISHEEMMNYAKVIFNPVRKHSENIPSLYSPIIIKELCEWYCRDVDELANVFGEHGYFQFVYPCIWQGKIDILIHIFEKYDIKNYRNLNPYFAEAVFLELIVRKDIVSMKLLYDWFDIQKLYYEDLIVEALLTNDMEIIKFVERFKIYIHDELVYNLLHSINNMNIFDNLIINNCLDALKYIIEKMAIRYDHIMDRFYLDNVEMDFRIWIPECEKRGYGEMIEYIMSLGLKN